MDSLVSRSSTLISGLEEQEPEEYGQVLPKGGEQLKARDKDDM